MRLVMGVLSSLFRSGDTPYRGFSGKRFVEAKLGSHRNRVAAILPLDCSQRVEQACVFSEAWGWRRIVRFKFAGDKALVGRGTGVRSGNQWRMRYNGYW